MKSVEAIWRDYDRAAARLLAALEPTACQKLGCSACCAFPAEVLASEARAVRRAVLALDEDVWAGVQARAQAWAGELRARGLAGTFPSTHDRRRTGYAAIYSRGLGLMCPLLDPQTRRCLIYASRPLSCRSMWRMGDEPCSDRNSSSEPPGHIAVRALAGFRLIGKRKRVRFHLLGDLVTEWMGGPASVGCVERVQAGGKHTRRLARRIAGATGAGSAGRGVG